MRVYDLILKKRNGGELAREEIEFLINGYTAGKIPDYQMAALTMAIWFRGMTDAETLELTLAMLHSGETVSLAAIPGIKVDKHSTGGVGDTTTLVLAPLVAAAGVPVVKMSGRGLGHTGGTVDKLESIPGFRTELSAQEMLEAVRRCGVAVVGQTGNLVPADKKLYALRDVTATVDSLPLIAASIMSKKLAAGADALVLDVKAGDGAFLKDLDRAFELARAMVEIGTGAGRETVAVVTGMDQPLGCAVGNALEVKEAIATLRGEGPADLEELCLVLGGRMLCLAGAAAGTAEAEEKLRRLLREGRALAKFRELVRSQGGDDRVADDPGLLPDADLQVPVAAPRSGYVHRIRATEVGLAAMRLGAGRETKGAAVDPAAGIVLAKKVGDKVRAGETLAVLHTSPGREEVAAAAQAAVTAAYTIGDVPCDAPPLVYGCVDRQGEERTPACHLKGED